MSSTLIAEWTRLPRLAKGYLTIAATSGILFFITHELFGLVRFIIAGHFALLVSIAVLGTVMAFWFGVLSVLKEQRDVFFLKRSLGDQHTLVERSRDFGTVRFKARQVRFDISVIVHLHADISQERHRDEILRNLFDSMKRFAHDQDVALDLKMQGPNKTRKGYKLWK